MAEPAGGGGSPNGGVPWAARLGLYLLEHVAPWTLITSVGLALITGWLPFPVLSAFLALRDDVAQLVVLVRARDQALARITAIQEQTRDAQQATCWNTSKTAEDQRRCYRLTPNYSDDNR